MHVANQLFTESFAARIDGVRAEIDAVMPGWSPHDRFGLVVNAPLGGLGASLLLQLAIANFYAIEPARRTSSPLYPEIYLFHVGGPHGDFSSFDFWPPRKEVRLNANHPLSILEALNDRAITRVALPASDAGDPARLADGPSSWAEQASARHRLRSCFLYTSDGRLGKADIELESHDSRTIDNVDDTLHLVEVAAAQRRAVATGDSLSLAGPTLPSDVTYWADRVDRRAAEVPAQQGISIRLTADRREAYRRLDVETAFEHLASL